MTLQHEDRMVLTVEEAAERLSVGRTRIYALVTKGEVESMCIGRLRRIPTRALDDVVGRLRSSQLGVVISSTDG